MKRLIQLLIFTFLACSADAQRIKLLQLERYLGDTIPFRYGYVGLTNTVGDQEYKKLDSIIVHITDSLIADLPDEDTDDQYFDTAVIINDTLILSIHDDNLPATRVSLKGLIDHDFYEVGTTTPPNNISDNMYNTGKVTIGDNASYTQALAVPLSDIRVQEIIIGYSADGESSNLRIGKNSLLNNVFGSGINNTAIGVNTLENNTSGDENFALGARALKDNTTGGYNTAIGADALQKNTMGTSNVGLGSATIWQCLTCGQNVAIGFGSMYSRTSGDNNIGIGYQSLYNNSSNQNIAIGSSAMYNATGQRNVGIGHEALFGNTGNTNVAIGYVAGRNNTGTGSVFLGAGAGINAVGSNQLWIENSTSGTPLIWGDFAGDTVRINGSLQVTNRTGTATTLAGWRSSDNKAVNTGLGTGLSIVSGTLTYTPLIDQFEIIDDTLYISETGDGVDPFFVDLKSYIDTATAGYDTDSQSISQFYVDMDSLIINLTRGNRKAVYLGDLISIVETDNQRFDSAYLDDCTLILSIQRDSVPAYEIDLCSLLDDTDTDDQYFDTLEIVNDTLRISIVDDGELTYEIDLKPYIQTYAHNHTANHYDNTLSNGGGAWSLDVTTGLSLTGTGGAMSLANTGMITWFLDGLDDAFASTEIFTGNVASFQGAGGITANLAADGSSTMVIDGTNLQFYVDAGGTPALIGDSPNETVLFTGTGAAILSISGNTINVDVPIVFDGDTSSTNEIDIWNLGANGSYTTVSNGDSVNFVESGSVTITRVGREITIDVPAIAGGDHDWYESGTTDPPNNIGDTMYHMGYTAIGMEHPLWILDVVSDARISGHHIGTGPTVSSNSNLRFGMGALAVNTASHNIAIGRAALGSNVGVSTNIAIGNEAMTNHTGGSGLNIAIGHSALNNSVLSYDNTAIGHTAMYASITASYNTALGHGALSANLRGDENTSLGDYTLLEDTNSIQNTAVGRYSMITTRKTKGNVGVGYQTLANVKDSANYNTAIGYDAMYGSVTSTKHEYNTAVGYRAMRSVANSSDRNIFIGYRAGETINGNNNIGIGDSVLFSTSGNNNVVLGNKNTTGSVSDNVIIGYNQHLTTAGNVVLTNGLGSAAGLRMLTTGFWGVNEANPTQRWHINGNMRLTGHIYDVNNEAGVDGQFLSKVAGGVDWVTNTGMSSFNINGIDDAFAPTAITNGQTIAFQGANGITAKLPVLGSGTIVIDGAGITGTTNLGFNVGSNPSLTSSNGSDVIFQDGPNVDFQYVNGFTITAALTGVVTSVGIGGNSGISVLGSPVTSSGTIVLSLQNDLLALENLTSQTGMMARTATNTWVNRSIVGGTGITVTNGDGVSGNPTISLSGGAGTVTSVAMSTPTGITVAGSPITSSGTFTLTLNNDLQGVENLGTLGIVVRSASNTWITRSLGAGPGINLSAADGTSANPTITAQVVDVVAGNNISVTDVGGTHTVAQPAFTSLATGFSSTRVVYIDASGTPHEDPAFTWNQGTGLLSATNLLTTSITATGITGLTTIGANLTNYASDAAAGAGGLTAGRFYRTGGVVMVKL